MDADPTVAEEIANRCSAVPTTNASSVIEADDVDVVAVCSPDAAHAEQVVAACRAGKRAVLCEKPLAASTAEVRAVAAAAKAADTLVVVGTMHAYDPAYRVVLRAWEERREQASFVARRRTSRSAPDRHRARVRPLGVTGRGGRTVTVLSGQPIGLIRPDMGDLVERATVEDDVRPQRTGGGRPESDQHCTLAVVGQSQDAARQTLVVATCLTARQADIGGCEHHRHRRLTEIEPDAFSFAGVTRRGDHQRDHARSVRSPRRAPPHL